MAVSYQAPGILHCLSTDSKPAGPDGLILFEEDTGKLFLRSSAAWVEKFNPAYQMLVGRVTGSNATTTGQALVDIAGLIAPLVINSVYTFYAILGVQSSSAAGNQYGINYSVAGGTIEAQITGTLLAATQQCARMSALNTASTPFCTGAISGGIMIGGTVTTGANAGNLTVKHLKVTSGTSTVFINSTIQVWKIG